MLTMLVQPLQHFGEIAARDAAVRGNAIGGVHAVRPGDVDQGSDRVLRAEPDHGRPLSIQPAATEITDMGAYILSARSAGMLRLTEEKKCPHS